jgi:hypothetical protein
MLQGFSFDYENTLLSRQGHPSINLNPLIKTPALARCLRREVDYCQVPTVVVETGSLPYLRIVCIAILIKATTAKLTGF